MKRSLAITILAVLISLPLAAADDCSLLSTWGERGITRDLLFDDGFVIAADGRGVTVYDVSNPAVVRHHSVAETGAEALKLAVSGGTLAVLTSRTIDVFALGQDRSLTLRQSVPDVAYTQLAAGSSFIAAAGSLLDIYTISGGLLDRTTSVALPNTASSLIVVGDVVYVASLEGGIRPYRFANGTLQALDPISVAAVDLASQGSFIYAAGRGSGVTPIDVSTPSSPVTHPRVLSGESDIRGVAVAGTRLYAADALNGSKIHVFDLPSPGAPVLVATFDAPADVIEVGETHLYTSGTLPGAASGVRLETGSPLRVFDVTTPSEPRLAGEFLDRAGPLSGVATDGSYAYIADPPLLRVIDIRNPRQPREVASIALDDSADRVRLDDHRLIAYGRADVHMIDVSSPAHPIYRGVYRSGGTIPSGADYSGELLIEANKASGFHVLDVSDPTIPFQLSGLRNDSFGTFLGVVALPKVAYGFASRGIKVVDLSDPTVAILDHVIATNSLVEAEIAPVTPTHPPLLLIIDGASLRVLELNNPLAPREIGGVPIPNDTVDLAAGPDVGYLVTRSGNLLRVDYRVAQSPTITTVVSGLIRPTQVAISEDGTGPVVVADGYSLKVFADPAAARLDPPAAPVLSAGESAGPRGVDLIWTGSGPLTYEVQTSPTPDFAAPAIHFVSGNRATIAVEGTRYIRVRATTGCRTSAFSNVISLSADDRRTPRFLQRRSRVFVTGDSGMLTASIPVINESEASVEVSFAGALPSGITAGPAVTLEPRSRGFLTLSIDRSTIPDQPQTLVELLLSLSGDSHTLEITRLTVSSNERVPGSSLLILPGVASAPGQRGTFFRSDVNIVCRPGQDCPLSLSFFLYNSSDNARTVVMNLRGGESIVLRDVVPSVFGLENSVGAIEIRSTALDNLHVSGSTYNEGGPGRYGQRLSAWRVDPSNSSQPFARRFLGVAQNATFRTNVGFVNGTASPQNVSVQLLSVDGNLLASASRTLDPWQGLQIGIAELFGVNGLDGASIRVEASRGVALYQSKVDQRTGDGTFSHAAPIPVEITPSGFPTYVRALDAATSTPGAEGTFFRTAIQLVNEGAETSELELTFIPTDNPAAAEVRRITLAPQAALSTEDLILSVLGNSGTWTGALRIESSAPFTGWGRIYNDSPDGTYGQFAPIHDVSPARKASNAAPETGPLNKIGVADAPSSRLMFAVSSTSEKRTNFGLFETAGKHARLRMEFYDSEGAFLGVFERGVTPYLSLPLFGVLEELGLSGIGDIRVQVDESDAESLSVYASLVERRTGDAVFIPAE